MSGSQCEVCGVSMKSPCGIICLSDCSVCWATYLPAESYEGPVALARINLSPATEKESAADAQFQLCATLLTPAQIASILTQLRPGVAIAAPKPGGARVTKTAKGTIEEIIRAFGLAPAAA
jgi:hypothetical protein